MGTIGDSRTIERVPRRLLLSSLLLLLLPWLFGCVTSRYRIAGPLFIQTETNETTDTILPPLLTRVETEKRTGDIDARILWPFVRYTRSGRESEFVFYPFFWDRKRVDHNGFIDRDLWSLPFILAGNSADEGDYLYVWPFGGTAHGFFGKDEVTHIGPWLPPFGFYMHWRDKAFHSTHIMPPFFNVVSGGGHEGWRLLPFFSHYERYREDGTPVYDRTHLLWPFFAWGSENMDTSPADYFTFMPFFGTWSSPSRVERMLLLLFHYEYADQNTEDEADDFWEVRAPFPLFVFHRGPHRSRSDIWPLFGTRSRSFGEKGDPDYERYNRLFVLEPIFRHERYERTRWTDTKTWFLPIYWSFSRQFEDPDDYWEEWKIWPLFRYRRDRDGTTKVNILSLLWFKDPEGFEAIYNPLFRVYHSYRDEETEEDVTSLLWGLYSTRESDEGETTWLHPFLWWNETDDAAETEENGYAFGIVRTYKRGPKHGLSLFWLPEITWTEEE